MEMKTHVLVECVEYNIVTHKRARCAVISCIDCSKVIYVKLAVLHKSTKRCASCNIKHYNSRNTDKNLCNNCKSVLTSNNYSESNKGDKRHICNTCYKARSKSKYKKIKDLVFNHYGRLCACCGEVRQEFLTIDHINNDGNIHRREIAGDIQKHKQFAGGKFYNWLVRNNFPENIQLQTLCWNCNCAKSIYGTCPHKLEQSE